jgi:hypothetical protein
MCNNRKIGERNERIEVLKRYSIKILSGESCKQIAEEEGESEFEVRKAIEEIKIHNPALYRQVKAKM